MKRTYIITAAVCCAIILAASFTDPIHDAASNGNLAGVQAELDKGVDVNLKTNIGVTPLHRAAFAGHKEVIELLIAKGADVNAKDKKGWTLLQHAVAFGQKEIVGLLIAKGADVNAKIQAGKSKDQTPLDRAIQLDQTETADLLRKHGGKTGEELKAAEPVAEASQPEPPTVKAPDISIYQAAIVGDIEAVKQHIAAGTDVNAKNKDGWTPLHHAAINGHKEIAELLIANGADVNAKEEDGWTPLHYAVYEGYKEIAELLIAKGADVNAKTINGITPLDYAEGEIADLLRKHGGKTGGEFYRDNKLRNELLQKAAGDGNIEAVKQQFAAGADVNAKGGMLAGTPLHYAAIKGHKEVVELLIAAGADVNAKDVNGKTPLDTAIFLNRTETVDLLRKHGGKTGDELN